jgi:hypothetical protein
MATTATKTRSHGQLKRYGVRRLREEWANTTSIEYEVGLTWYDEAHEWVHDLSVKHDRTEPQVAAIAASLSPRLPWHRAVSYTERMLDGEDISGLVLGRGLRKANEVLAGINPFQVLSGLKTTSFCHNLLGEYDWITIDTHSYHQVSGRNYNDTGPRGAHFLERAGVYEAYSDCFRQIGRDNSLQGAVIQAILWVHKRGAA